MKHDRFISRIIFIASLVLFPLVLAVGSPAAEPEKGTRAFSEKQVTGLKQIAVESVQDTLKACLGRIPLDASAGQLKLAEQNCHQGDAERSETFLTF